MTPQTMIADLMALGMTQREIAECIGTTQPTIFRILNGSEPRFSTGKRLEVLLAEKTGGLENKPAA